MKLDTYRALVDEDSCRLVDGLLIDDDPFLISEIREAKELAEAIEIVYGSSPKLENIIHETRIQCKEAERDHQILFGHTIQKAP